MWYMPEMVVRAPLEITDDLRSAVARAVGSDQIDLLPIDPLRTCQILQCFENVSKAVQVHGGERVLGWSICVWPRVWIELEPHCLWRKDGHLRDVTPREYGDCQVAFAQAASKRKNPLCSARIQVPLSDGSDEDVDRLVRYAKNPTYPIGSPKYRQHYFRLFSKVNWHPLPEDPCICGQPKRFGDCCLPKREQYEASHRMKA